MSSESSFVLVENETNTTEYHLASLFITYCKSRDERLTRKTAELIVGIFLLKPYWQEIFQKEASKNAIQNFMRECYDFLFDENSMSNKTIRMQCLFYGKYLSREQFKEYQKDVVMKNCHHLLQKLKKVWHNPTEDFSEMYDELVKFILIKEGMDDKDDSSAFEEIKTAISSVLPASEFSTFISSSQKMKTALLNEVSSVASGIRLHAWYSKKAGKFMFDVAKLMKDTLPKVSDDIYEEINSVKDRRDELQTQLKEDIEILGDNDKLLHKKQLLINMTNYFKFIKTLKENIDEIATETYRLDYKFTICIKELNSVLKSGPFVKADKAYPCYKEIGQTWKNLQSEGYLLDFYTNLFSELKEMHELALKLPEIEMSSELKLDDLKFEAPVEKPILVKADNVKNFSDVTLDIQGFCAFYCSMGVLISSIREIGILLYNNSCYGFSSNKAMKYFLKQPNICIELAIKYMHIMPELIISLCKEEHFGLPIINTSRYKDVLPVFVSERSIQTVLHSVEENMDHSYNWNQWDMRKEAIKYSLLAAVFYLQKRKFNHNDEKIPKILNLSVNYHSCQDIVDCIIYKVELLNKKTHSTQTDLSHFRRENFSQVYLPKDNWTQTRRDTGTSMSRTGVPELQMKIKRSFL